MLSRGILASVARLAYQVPEANKSNQTIIVMILMELKYVTPPPLWELPPSIPPTLKKTTSYSIIEHMIGLIVSSMPSLPAFVQHLRGGVPSSSTLFEPFPRSNRRRGGAAIWLDGPGLIHTSNGRYEELTELKEKKGTPTEREGLEQFVGEM